MTKIGLVLALVLAACGGKKSDDEIQRDYEQRLKASILAAKPAVDVTVTSTEVQIVASPDTCGELLRVVLREKPPIPKGEGVACGVAGDAPVWRMREHAGELADIGPGGLK